MIFTSSIFVILVVLLLIISPIFRNIKYRQVLFLFSSYSFYIMFDINFFWLILLISLIAYVFGILIYRSKYKLILTIVGVTLISSFIVFFKLQLYLNFTSHVDKIVLPLGISFYSFQAISYLVDIKRRKIDSENDLVVFLLYISFFPQLVAGPIERAANLIPQIKKFPFPTTEQFFLGLQQILYGCFLKIIVSNNLNNLTALLLDENNTYNNIHTVIGLILFYFQIYFDFHGYTNIAIGLANIFGIKLHQNFNLPFLANSMKDFWHRWHISLSTWFKDYLYIPLGGNRSKFKKAIVLIVFVISGLWHGPTYNFFFWGVFHGLIYLLEDEISPYINLGKPFSNMIVFGLVSFGWLFFYYDSLETIVNTLSNLIYSPWDNSIDYMVLVIINNKFILIVLIFAIFLNLFENHFFNLKPIKMKLILRFLIIDILVIMIILFGSLGNKEFIYFRF